MAKQNAKRLVRKKFRCKNGFPAEIRRSPKSSRQCAITASRRKTWPKTNRFRKPIIPGIAQDRVMSANHVFDATIIGAGPAGVSCAVWLQQLGFQAVLVDLNATCGGLQLRNPYTNTWIASSANAHGADVAQALHENAVRHGVALRLSRKARQARKEGEHWCVRLDDGEDLKSRILVLAGGVTPKSGGFAARASLLVGPGPQVANTDFNGTRVAILGGGDNAFENHTFVRERGAATVHIYARSIRARAEMLERVAHDDVIVGDFDVDASTNTVNGQRYDHLLVLFGYEVSKGALLGLEPALRPDGFVLTDSNCRTSIPGVYAIGELAQRAHPCCITAMADGVVAAKDIQRTLEQTRRRRYMGALKRGASLLGIA